MPIVNVKLWLSELSTDVKNKIKASSETEISSVSLR